MTLAQFQLVENSLLLSEFRFGLFVMEILLFMCSLFLMALVLVQRGKGGGLTGALGGMGGQSAFGSKAGDAFTKITIVTAALWIFLCMMTIALFNPPPSPASTLNNDPILSGTMGGENEDNTESNSEEDGESNTSDSTADGEKPGAPDKGESDGENTDSEPAKTEAATQPKPSGETTDTKSDVEEK